jgi:DNA-nicking Smr family endonuclease
MSARNKYKKEPAFVADLHGMTRKEAEDFLNIFLEDKSGEHVRLITGKGAYRNGPILQESIKEYLKKRGASYTYAKIQDGGEGALEVFLP